VNLWTNIRRWLSPDPDPDAEADANAVADECERRGDRWGQVIATGLAALSAHRQGRHDTRRLGGLVSGCRELGAGVLQAWAQAFLALAAAAEGLPDAGAQAQAAASQAASVGVPGGTVAATVALARIDRGRRTVLLREAESQDLFARYYEGHPVIRVPHVLPELSTPRVLTSELVSGATFDELLGWDQHERDLAAETIHRFVFRSLYRLHAFNGDPHPGNYLFHRGGRVTFLDFGLTKRFTDQDLAPLVDAVRFLVFEKDYEAFRAALERAGFLRAGAPVPTKIVVDRFGQFYGTVLQDAPMTLTPAYASAIVRRFFDARGPLAPYSDVPRAYVIMQRINLGLYAVLGSLNATANWRRIAEEIWPFRNGPPSTPIGEAEAAWEADRCKVPRKVIKN